MEIDKLAESRDWQGVILAAARFESNQTFDGESSFLASSASRSSQWTGSATFDGESSFSSRPFSCVSEGGHVGPMHYCGRM